MNEITFIETNKASWKKLSGVIEGRERVDVAEVIQLYTRAADDLSYARTHYPESRVVQYLNAVVLNAHRFIYKNKYGNRSRLIRYWTEDIPLAIYRQRRKILAAFVLFLLAFLIGWFSASLEDSFVRMVMGDSYVNMTEQNIEEGDPLAVYGKMNESDMFFGIGINNIRVAFLAFVLGIFTFLGTAIVILFNGIMVGTFFYFFYKAGLAPLAWSTIMIHGTLELSAIAIAGGAGFVLGSSFLFPGTYSRSHALRQGASEGLKIMVALIPVFIAAAFLESYLTRTYLSMTMLARMTVIILSLSFIVWYFYLYSKQIYERNKIHRTTEVQGVWGNDYRPD